MKVCISAHIQFSLFSSGAGGTSLAVAEAFRNMGNEVWIANTHSETEWWDDCPSLKGIWASFLCRVSDLKAGKFPGDKKPFDLFIEVEKPVFSSPEERKLVASSCVWLLRKSPILHDIEATLFPFDTSKRTTEGIQACWCFDKNTSEDDLKYLEVLTRVPAVFVPFTWTPSIVEIYRAETKSPSWDFVTATKDKTEPWSLHICETNNSASTSLTIPLTILRDIKKRGGFPLKKYTVHNAEHVNRSQFFLQNVKAHCEHPDLSSNYIGRQRVIDWVNDAKSCVLSHMRFMTIRPYLLEAAWVGIPVVHNSLGLKEVDEYSPYFYPDNDILAAEKALERMNTDFQEGKGIFEKDVLSKIRSTVLSKFSSYSVDICNRWGAALKALKEMPVTSQPTPTPQVTAAAAASAPKVREVKVLFTDMWDDFQADYNMFILMMNEAGRHMKPPVRAIGLSIESLGSQLPDLLIFGPFGDTWQRFGDAIPKVHYTGENSGVLNRSDIKLNIGYQHADFKDQEHLRIPLWMLEVDWFGAKKDRIVNPKPLSIDRCTSVYPEDLSMKQKFCAFVVTNPCNEIRNASFHWLSQYKQVDSAGRLFNNVGDAIFAGRGGGGGELKKFEFLRNYKFCLAYENSSSQGYTTEKYLHAKAAGCIPIYWGDPKVERDFDPAGFIDARNFTRPEQIIEAVQKVDKDPSLWLKMFSVPALDDTRRDLVRRTLSECSRRLWKLALGGKDEGLDTIPRFLGATNDKEAAEIGKEIERFLGAKAEQETPIPEVVSAPLITTRSSKLIEAPKEKKKISSIVVVTAATKRFLPSLHQWIVSIQAQRRDPSIEIDSDIWLGDDIEQETEDELKTNFSWVRFHRFPKDMTVEGFDDLWNPQHFAWKLWLLKEVNQNELYSGKLVLYLDSGIFMCRWPTDWLYIAKENGICVLEDPRQINEQWCHAEFCKALSVTTAEKTEQQLWAGAIAFEAGHSFATKLFSEAWIWGQKRDVIVGPKWEGVRNGKPYGHRHDQSILSILTSRLGVARYPMDNIYCAESLRRTFLTKKAFYVHRGGFTVHKKFADAIDDCYVINLDRRADRMEKLYKNSPELEGRIQRVSAVEGQKLTLTPAIARLFRPHDFNWKKPVMGCALSHLTLWWQLANEKDDIDSYLILEDDVKFASGWEARWKEAAAHLPEGWDVIYLGGILPPNRGAFETVKEKVNPYFSRIAENTIFYQNPPNRYFHWCAYSYVLSKQGARKIIEILKARDGYWTSADHMICNPISILKMYFLDPLMAGCYQDDDPRYQNSAFNDFSRVDGFDSDLWNNNECFPKEEANLLANKDTPLDITTALAEARQYREEPKVVSTVAETVVGKESSEDAKLRLKDTLQTKKFPEWDTFFDLIQKDALLEARKHAFTMLANWKAEWQELQSECFTKFSEVLTIKELSDLPSKEKLIQMLQEFRFKLEQFPMREKCDCIQNAFVTLINFGSLVSLPAKIKGRRLVAFKDQDLKAENMYEKTWLQEIFGKDFSLEIHGINPQDEPPTDEPILIIMRPYLKNWVDLLKSWSEKGIKYYVLHLSDEHGVDPLTFYHSPDCLGVVRMYYREETEGFGDKVLTIPLGYHWTKGEGVDDPELRTPRLPFREKVWSFMGTAWNERPEKMKNLTLLQPHTLTWFKEWNDAAMMGRDEYLNILLDSRFVPVPGGMNAETYRFYEALECGCIPVYVRQDGDKGFIEKLVRRWIPIPDITNWDQATALIYELSNNPVIMEDYRHKCLLGWKAWKEDIKQQVRKIFHL